MKAEETWLRTVLRPFARLPEWAKIILILWTLLSVVVAMVEPLHQNLPPWFAVVIAAPYAFILFVIVIPALLMSWGRVIAWPFKRAAALLRKAH